MTQTTGKSHEAIDDKDIEFHLKGGLSIVKNHELIDADINELKKQDRENHLTRDKLSSKTGKHLFFNKVIDRLQGKRIDNAEALKVCKWLQKNHQELAANRLGNYKNISQRPIQQLGGFLKLCGYELAEKKDRLGNRTYLLMENAQVIEYVNNRRQKTTAV